MLRIVQIDVTIYTGLIINKAFKNLPLMLERLQTYYVVLKYMLIETGYEA